MSEHIHTDLIEQALTETFGPRCPDFDVSCFGCQAWAQLQELKDAPLSAQAEATEAAAKVVRDLKLANKAVSGRYALAKAEEAIRSLPSAQRKP